MRYILFIFLCISQIANSQISDFQIKGSTPKDTLFILGTDTTAAGTKRGLGKWYNAYDLVNGLAVGGGGGATNLSIAQSGGTQVIQSSTGTDVGVRNLYGLLITEGATDTLHFRVDSSLFATAYDITQIPISSLKAATATNTINNANYAQEWQWNTLTSGTALKLISTGTAGLSGQKMLEVGLAGENAISTQSTTAASIYNSHTGTNAVNKGIDVTVSGGIANTGISVGVSGSASDLGVLSSATSGTGIYAQTETGVAIKGEANPSSTTTVVNLADFRRLTSGTAAAGIGGNITFTTETATSSAVSNTISSKWTTATHASRVSDFIVSGVNNAITADLFTLKGDGKTVLNKYGVGSFTGTPVADLFVTATGEIIEGSMTGQSWLADADDATAAALISNQTLKFGGAAGIVTDLFNNVATDSITIAVDGSEWTTTAIYESDDWMQMYDAGSSQLQRINQANFITELNSLLTVAGDGNGIYGGDGTTPTDVDVTMTDNIDFGAGALFIDDANGEIGIGTNTPDYGLDLESNTANFHIKDLNGGSGSQISIESVQETGVVSGITFQYTDSDYAGGALQQPYAIEVNRRVNNKQSSTFIIDAQDATNASVFIAQKNEDFSDNTTESAIAINGGIAFTQNFDISTSGNLTLDRSYYVLNVTGGALGDTIKLPEVASTSDNWDSALTTAQAQVGQEYVITNFKTFVGDGTDVVRLAAHNPTSGNSDLINSKTNITGASTIAIPNGGSIQVKCVRLASGVGYWYTY